MAAVDQTDPAYHGGAGREQLPLTFDEVTAASVARRDRWHTADTEPWTGADWSNAFCGEAGEAANVVKKLRRIETGFGGDPAPLLDDLAMELADVVAYLVLLAAHYEIDLPLAVARKFNQVSAARGFPEMLREVER